VTAVPVAVNDNAGNISDFVFWILAKREAYLAIDNSRWDYFPYQFTKTKYVYDVVELLA
jgi:hypothetical protein